MTSPYQIMGILQMLSLLPRELLPRQANCSLYYCISLIILALGSSPSSNAILAGWRSMLREGLSSGSIIALSHQTRRLRLCLYGIIGYGWKRYLHEFFKHSRHLTILTAIALYSKSGGKNGKHCAVTDSTNISAISYVALQVYEYAHGAHFRPFTDATALFQTKQFILLPSTAFLYALRTAPRVSSTGIDLNSSDLKMFHRLQAGRGKFKDAAKLFKKRANKEGEIRE